jgi:hypothetical protein
MEVNKRFPCQCLGRKSLLFCEQKRSKKNFGNFGLGLFCQHGTMQAGAVAPPPMAPITKVFFASFLFTKKKTLPFQPFF